MDEYTFTLKYEQHLDDIIEMPNMRCMFVGYFDVKCTGKVVGVSAQNFGDIRAQNFLEKNCDTFPKMAASRKCIFTIRFEIGPIDQKHDAQGQIFTRVQIRDPMHFGLGVDSKFLN